ncbi:MAG: hypothetical protein COX57_09020 [Alphaproteobacteria bacterium CG_4_10_14_0_2_um_filter_63_37]|nr:MAG: hypothetical protein COX57_09020 [Alphaproteobacteria bacterium CG_4_10_14_0_2_um_filter_63_37]
MTRWQTLLGAGLLLLGAVGIGMFSAPHRPTVGGPIVETRATPPHQRPIPFEEHHPPPLNPPVVSRPYDGPPRLAVVIDDMGQLDPLDRRVVALPGVVTCSILPYAPHADTIARLAHDSGKPVFAHMPMEAVSGSTKTGPGTLYHTMDRQTLIQAVDAALDRVPGVEGVNNHMGSLLTADLDAMQVVMEALARRRVGFLDSRTTAQTVAQAQAQSHGIPNTKRDVFLDNEPDEIAIAIALRHAVDLARKRGYAVAIGHPHVETVAVLERLLPEIKAEGVSLVSATDVMSR